VAAQSGRWGWHRLDSRWITRLIEDAHIRRGDLVIDIGAGDGRITSQLLERGASVIAVELHPDRATELRRRFAHQDVVVVCADASDLRLPRRPFKVVANPPFAITTALLRRLTSPKSRLEVASVVVPTWAAARWTAGRGVGGITSQRRFHFDHGGHVPARAFHPPPPSDAAILLIRASSAPGRR
jgi:23S rRNA (adenine-N6)-dimethyltransferase